MTLGKKGTYVKDQYGRTIDWYPNIGDDRCNWRCVYHHTPEEGVEQVAHEEIPSNLSGDCGEFAGLCARMGDIESKIDWRRAAGTQGLYSLVRFEEMRRIEQVTLDDHLW